MPHQPQREQRQAEAELVDERAQAQAAQYDTTFLSHNGIKQG